MSDITIGGETRREIRDSFLKVFRERGYGASDYYSDSLPILAIFVHSKDPNLREGSEVKKGIRIDFEPFFEDFGDRESPGLSITVRTDGLDEAGCSHAVAEGVANFVEQWEGYQL